MIIYLRLCSLHSTVCSTCNYLNDDQDMLRHVRSFHATSKSNIIVLLVYCRPTYSMPTVVNVLFETQGIFKKST